MQVGVKVPRQPRCAGGKRQIERIPCKRATDMFVIVAVVVMIMGVRMRMVVAVTGPGRPTCVAPGRQCDPAAKTDERKARCGIDQVP